ncbi:MAG TPA: hypothetical protein VHI75_00160 [Casimicrobiaceae bacterium]|nr:hypothetical protein [Casimicrobiaceae bacterium]
MPSARELLEQADALMRKNRSRGDSDIPLLTDAVGIAPLAAPIAASALAVVAPPATLEHTDVPLLTEAVEEVVIEFEPLPERPVPRAAIMEGDPSDWLVMDTIDPATHSITGRAPDTLAVVPPMTLKAAGSAATPPPAGSQAREQTSAPTEPSPPSMPPTITQATAERAPGAADQELWRALAEQISMQVLQRLDLFTDTGLKEQLARHLEPIVERASTELVGAITEHVGRLLRTYVSEAIEREIAQWKRDQH